MSDRARPRRPGTPLTASSCVNALGVGDAVWAGLLGAQSGLVPARLAAARSVALRPMLEGLPFETAVGLVPDEVLEPLPAAWSAYDTRQARLALAGVQDLRAAVVRARTRLGAERVGLVLGTSTGGVEATESSLRRNGGLEVGPSFDLERHHAMLAAVEVLRGFLGCEGPSYVVSTACSSSAKAFASAKRWLDVGLVDAVVVGGVDTLCGLTLRGFEALELLAREPCRPFAVARSGLSIGEGAAFALLEREGEGAVELVAVGESSDAHHMSAPHPEGAGAQAAIADALGRGGVSPVEVGHLHAHGTATRLNDHAEAMAIARIFGARVPVVASKGSTGHLLGAAGATQVVLMARCLEADVLPASVGATPLDAALGVEVVTKTRAGAGTCAVSCAFAFGGHNAAVVLRKRDAA